MKRIITVTGPAIPQRGNDIDTDAIVPARDLEEITFSRMGEYPFYDERDDATSTPQPHVFNDARYRGTRFLFVNRNFDQVNP